MISIVAPFFFIVAKTSSAKDAAVLASCPRALRKLR